MHQVRTLGANFLRRVRPERTGMFLKDKSPASCEFILAKSLYTVETLAVGISRSHCRTQRSLVHVNKVSISVYRAHLQWIVSGNSCKCRIKVLESRKTGCKRSRLRSANEAVHAQLGTVRRTAAPNMITICVYELEFAIIHNIPGTFHV